MVMTLAKITAGTGYTYLTRHTARGDASQANDHDTAAYYTAQGNPPGRWTGRGAPLLGLAGREVTEDQMRALFGLGEHPDGETIIAAYLKAHVRAGMSDQRWHPKRLASIQLIDESFDRLDSQRVVRCAEIHQVRIVGDHFGDSRFALIALEGFDFLF